MMDANSADYRQMPTPALIEFLKQLQDRFDATKDGEALVAIYHEHMRVYAELKRRKVGEDHITRRLASKIKPVP
ncbi:hypothetical protein HY633_04225 [Candidatus Uhrbacteria bacterium]|nr:hypothetical protein [Candidatus Uhrbacteria bacterium]